MSVAKDVERANSTESTLNCGAKPKHKRAPKGNERARLAERTKSSERAQTPERTVNLERSHTV
jgi:hypothetical protein